MPLPDLIEIVPLTQPVRAEITVPGSKSITNRALILAALAEGDVTLTGALWSEDTQVMVEALKVLGFEVKVELDAAEFCNRTISVRGLGGKIPNAGTPEKPLELFVGNAGTAARFLAAMVCLGSGTYRLSGVPRMHERPQAALFKALRELGYRVESANEMLPAVIHGGGEAARGSGSRSTSDNQDATTESKHLLSGEAAAGHRPALHNRACTVCIEASSQFASALLLSAKHGGWNVTVAGDDLEEAPYVTMTEQLVKVFPQSGGRFQIEPDASSGSYFWAASGYDVSDRSETHSADGRLHTLSTKLSPTVVVRKWPNSGWQIDAKFPEYASILSPPTVQTPGEIAATEKMLAELWGPDWKARADREHQHYEETYYAEHGPVIVSREKDLGDSIMTVIVLSPLGSPRMRFSGIGRLRVQECDRVAALRTELTKCGAKVIEEGDTLTVYPSTLHGAEIETYNDHRMAMCFAILGLKVPGIKIKNPACVKKTFPNFFQKLATPPPNGLGAEIRDGHTGRKLEMEELFAD